MKNEYPKSCTYQEALTFLLKNNIPHSYFRNMNGLELPRLVTLDNRRFLINDGGKTFKFELATDYSHSWYSKHYSYKSISKEELLCFLELRYGKELFSEFWN